MVGIFFVYLFQQYLRRFSFEYRTRLGLILRKGKCIYLMVQACLIRKTYNLW